MRILFVCSGNTCRSPLAEAIARRMLAETGREDVIVESAGTSAWDGSPASDGAILIGVERNLDLAQHRARRLTPEMVEASDLVFVMSHEHLARVREIDSTATAYLLGGYAESSPRPIPDPFGGELDDYRA
ncbi:MAG TPA: low molecular weight protein arginine phosphatase, partial [Gemmatimonadaceae bacterium]|nr:low molecular weight protein arginine phosphatase [Gemmatimonadaceae bacterium]